MWIVPLSLLHANQFDLRSYAIEYMVAYYDPLLSSWMHYNVFTSNILMIVPFYEAVAILNPFGQSYNAHRTDLWAYIFFLVTCP